ncbi:hypothetical protein IAI18_15575 [Acetobacteraceae bacterium H6797]|nr:hypothetical protein [Acetobacteraceae bacterium H6797]
MSARLGSIGALLVAIGIVAYVIGWDALLWIPRAVMDSLVWLPNALADAFHSAPWAFGIIAVGVVLMLVSRMMERRGK